jgi:drug/metabolite transporter (DMT)-like permease
VRVEAGTSVRGWPGVVVAGVTSAVSGVSVFVNSYGVHAIDPPAAYTTAKNVVATVLLITAGLVGRAVRRRRAGSLPGRFVTPTGQDGAARGWRAWGPAQWAGLAYVGVVGGGLAFVLFFDGLAATAAEPAAFWRDTLVVWVGVLAVPALRERLRWWNLAAVVLLMAGQVAIAGGVGHLVADRGEVLVLASSLLWAVEVVVAKRLLRDVAPATLSVARMGIGAAALLVMLASDGGIAALRLDATQLVWALVTGALLAGYVATWFSALARTRALDVTSILPASVLVTWLLETMAGSSPTAAEGLGLALVALGAATVVWMHLRRSADRRPVLP